jgi:hypothetical protein
MKRRLDGAIENFRKFQSYAHNFDSLYTRANYLHKTLYFINSIIIPSKRIENVPTLFKSKLMMSSPAAVMIVHPLMFSMKGILHGIVHG